MNGRLCPHGYDPAINACARCPDWCDVEEYLHGRGEVVVSRTDLEWMCSLDEEDEALVEQQGWGGGVMVAGDAMVEAACRSWHSEKWWELARPDELRAARSGMGRALEAALAVSGWEQEWQVQAADDRWHKLLAAFVPQVKHPDRLRHRLVGPWVRPQDEPEACPHDECPTDFQCGDGGCLAITDPERHGALYPVPVQQDEPKRCQSRSPVTGARCNWDHPYERTLHKHRSDDGETWREPVPVQQEPERSRPKSAHDQIVGGGGFNRGLDGD